MKAAARRLHGDGRTGIEELRARGEVPVHAIQRLAAADAFRSIGPRPARRAVGLTRAEAGPDLPLFA